MADTLTVTYLNRQGGGFAERHTLPAGTTVKQFFHERVEDPEQVPAALERALKVVREEKRQALLNIIGQ